MCLIILIKQVKNILCFSCLEQENREKFVTYRLLSIRGFTELIRKVARYILYFHDAMLRAKISESFGGGPGSPVISCMIYLLVAERGVLSQRSGNVVFTGLQES